MTWRDRAYRCSVRLLNRDWGCPLAFKHRESTIQINYPGQVTTMVSGTPGRRRADKPRAYPHIITLVTGS
ncbi:hypothetical protein WM46_23625 [Citrobacter freundii complex sp. CFNIH2]|nr:hypothetical protein WM46_23625 [Citrobacter freundii complex sp. CFNIH2]